MARTTTITIEISRYEGKLILMKFKLKEIPVNIFLGVLKEERKEKQKILISLSFKFDTKKAEKSDNIEDTIDYFEIYEFVQKFPKDREFKLLEFLYKELETAVSKSFPKIKKLKIKIKKFPFTSGSITISK